MNLLCVRLLSLCVLSCFGMTGMGADWPRLIAEAQFQPPTLDAIEQQRGMVLHAIQGVTQRMQREANGESWLKYLAVAELGTTLGQTASQLSAEAEPFKAQTARLDKLRERMVGGHRGLEMPEVLRLRSALAQYVRLRQTYESQAEVAEALPKRLEKLQLALPSSGQSFTNESFHAAALEVQWLKAHGIGTRLTQTIEGYSQPNLLIRVTKDAIGRVTQTPVYETKPIDEYDDGRHITGQAIAVGSARLIPIDTSQAGQCKIAFEATVNSTLNGKEGPVSFRLSGLTNLRADKLVQFTSDAFTLLPTGVQSHTQMRTEAVCTKRDGPVGKLVRRVATKFIAKEHPAAAKKINDEAKQEFVKEFEKQVAEELSEAHRDLREDVFAPLARLDMQPKSFDFLTNSNLMTIALRVDAGLGLTTHDVPPSIVEPHHVGILVHESVVNQATERLLAGESFEDLAQAASSAGLKLSPEQKEGIPKLGIQFAASEPVRVWFQDDMIKVQIAGDSFTVGSALLDAMNVSLKYRVERVGGRVKLTLVGEPEVTRPAGKGMAGRFLAQRRVLKKRLDDELPRDLSLDAPKLPEPANKLGKLQFTKAAASGGWLNFALLGS